jgi:hypothetical protein
MRTGRRVKVGPHLLKVLERDTAYEYPEELGNAPADVVRVFNKLTDLLSELQDIEDKHPFVADKHIEKARHALDKSIGHLRQYGHALSPLKRRVRKTSPKVAKEGYPVQWYLDGHLRGQKSPVSPYRSPKKKSVQRKSRSPAAAASKKSPTRKPSMTVTSTMHVHGMPVQTKRRVPARKLVKP